MTLSLPDVDEELTQSVRAAMPYAATLGIEMLAASPDEVRGLPEGSNATATIESKTNFFRAVREGGVVEARSRPLHRGRTTIVVETDVFDDTQKHVARVTQTQAVL